jgi:predicted pyridoxine 5'-phosphate oxidase superfamily flavin-nucleotide-binding protein
MGRTYETIDEKLRTFVEAQPVFFVATAPLDANGHVNCSPKGNRGNFAVLGPRRVGFQDLTGSGVETISHVRENGRIVIMFCAFDGPPRIVRFRGHGEIVEAADDGYAGLAAHFPDEPGIRAVVVVDVDHITDSCGYGVPIMPFDHHRPNMDHWTDTKGPDGLAAYRAANNATSIDGLPGLGSRAPAPAP